MAKMQPPPAEPKCQTPIIRNFVRLMAFLLFIIMSITFVYAISQVRYDLKKMEAIDKLRDRDLRPEKVMDVIGLNQGMIVGEAGASYGYFTLWISQRVGNKGIVYANDIDAAVLGLLAERYKSKKITNIKTVLGSVDDPLFPSKDLDMIVVFDCLFEFSQPLEWMQNAGKYLKPEGKLAIVDPDPSKIGNAEDFLSRKKIHEFAGKSGYRPIQIEDSFLKSHMIIVLQPADHQ